MSTNLAQEFLFQRIKEMLPQNASLVETVADVLHLSSDSAYRRIRNETPLILDEAKQLCDHFHLSLDQLLNVKSNSILFQNTRINNQVYSFEKYLSDLLNNLKLINSFEQKEIVYLTKDVPLFHNFYFQPLAAFRYFFWMKTILQHPDFANRGIDLHALPPGTETLSLELVKNYTLLPSIEIWNTECINAIISQIEFYKESGHFSSAADMRSVYEALKETIAHLKAQVEWGCKFMPGENPQTKKNNFTFFYNRVILGETTILVKTGNEKTVYLNHGVLDYIVTRDEKFCNQCNDNLQNLMRRSTLISQTSEKQRNIFFGILLAKIGDRIKNL
jgi:hypothetical protein